MLQKYGSFDDIFKQNEMKDRKRKSDRKNVKVSPTATVDQHGRKGGRGENAI
jgi:hypothetical protein